LLPVDIHKNCSSDRAAVKFICNPLYAETVETYLSYSNL